MSFVFEAAAYGPMAARLLSVERLPELGPGTANRAALAELEALSVETLFAHTRLGDVSMGQACVSGLWLYHDFLDRSHTVSQSIHTPTGSYWHGIMHRREPDADNAAYWFRRVGAHPVFEPLAESARQIAEAIGPLKKGSWLAHGKAWDPFRFIELCEACRGHEDEDQLACRRVSLEEWRLLFDYSYRQAVG